MSTTAPDPASSPLLHDPSAPALILSTTPPSDPPPPYPSARRARQARTGRRRRNAPDASDYSHLHPPSHEYDVSTIAPASQQYVLDGPDDTDPTETTPFLSPNPNSPRSMLPPGTITRRRTLSLTSTLRSSASLAPSFAHTVLSAFHPERDSDLDPDCRDEDDLEEEGEDDEFDSPVVRDYDPQQRAFAAELSGYTQRHAQRQQQQASAGARWRRYFRPLGRRAYYSALFHLLFINFPYALLSWVFLFVFTLVGTCTLMALPLGAVLCFVDLFGARVLARAELSMQSTFHGPLAYSIPWPPMPIFTRTRAPTAAQIEAGVSASTLVPEGSFYKNSYAMFTDPTSYQALFYFLVLKPGITVLMTLSFLVLVPLSIALVLPLPAVLRLARRMGIWQANVAVEGLYFAAR
ncbi:hypothetical protein BC628DRAFT_1358572 [Trametes gibbosa]|nr:hypothetical protein BC628DRAFT_1358572 [Trametes gibbosa]